METNLDTSRSSAQIDQGNQREHDQSDLEAELPKDSYNDERSEIEVAKKTMRSGTETEIPERLRMAGKKAGDFKRMVKKSVKKAGRRSNEMIQK